MPHMAGGFDRQPGMHQFLMALGANGGVQHRGFDRSDLAGSLGA